MMAGHRYIPIALFGLVLLGCGGSSGGFVNRGLDEHTRWLMKEVSRTATPAAKVKEGTTLNYQAQFNVHVASRTNRGQLYSPEERSELPDLVLYARIDGERVRLGETKNSLALMTDYPLRLKPGDTVELRLVDRKNSYYRVSYDDADKDDWSAERTEEAPLSQFIFKFEGPGRYFFHQGYGIVFVDFRVLR